VTRRCAPPGARACRATVTMLAEKRDGGMQTPIRMSSAAKADGVFDAHRASA